MRFCFEKIIFMIFKIVIFFFKNIEKSKKIDNDQFFFLQNHQNVQNFIKLKCVDIVRSDNIFNQK